MFLQKEAVEQKLKLDKEIGKLVFKASKQKTVLYYKGKTEPIPSPQEFPWNG